MSLKMPTTSLAGLIVDVQPAAALAMSGKNIDEVEAIACIVAQAEIVGDLSVLQLDAVGEP